MEYLHNSEEDFKTTIVLDGRKVRLGFEGEKLDPFLSGYSRHGEQLREYAKVFGDSKLPTQAIFEFNASLTQKLDGML